MKKREKNFLIIIFLFIVFLTAIFFANHFFGYEDFSQFFKWYIMLLLASIIGYPLSSYFFKDFNDRGYMVSKIIGVSVPSLVIFFLCNFKILKFTNMSCIIIFLVFILLSIIYLVYKYFKNVKSGQEKKYVFKNIQKIYRIEILFFILLVLISYVKGFNQIGRAHV